MLKQDLPHIAVIGGGPAGLMAAEVISAAGWRVDVYEAMPSLGRKLLRAGVGGLNITHSEPYETFCSRYGDHQPNLQPLLDRFPPDAVREWVHSLGIETFAGSSGKVFPKEMKAAPLLRAWLIRLRAAGVRLHVRHRWVGWSADGALVFATPDGETIVTPLATVLALGGASWPQLGSDGSWVPLLKSRDVEIAPLQSANCGFEVEWSPHMADTFSGSPVKSVALTFTDLHGRTEQRRGELVISSHGVEGSLIYAFSARLRNTLNANGNAVFYIDLLPGISAERVMAEVSHPRGSRSMSSHLQSRLGLSGVKMALLREVLDKQQFTDLEILATTIKAVPIAVKATRPIAEAISSAGGICFPELDKNLMLKKLRGTFVAGEMIDWEGPTGGYLLTACFATGLAAGEGVKKWLGAEFGEPA